MWTNKDPSNFTPRGFPLQPLNNRRRYCSTPPSSATNHQFRPASDKKWKPNNNVNNVNQHHHRLPPLPADNSPYGKAKHVQLVDKNPSKAISMFWAAINLGDRVDSALKDMTAATKQLDRSEEAIEAINSFRHLCSHESQDSLNNIMLELYKRCGRIQNQIQLLESRIKHIEDAATQNMNGIQTQITTGQDYTKLLGNLAWAYLQQNKYKQAEDIYRKALSLEPDKNKQCNLAICLMYMERMTEAKFLLSTVKGSNRSREKYESYAKSYERAVMVMHELESCKSDVTNFSVFLSRNKETDSEEEGANENCENMQKPYVSPFTNRGVLRTPITQPRVHDKEGLKGGYFRKLQFGQPLENTDREVKSPAKSGKKPETPLMTEAGLCRKISWADIAEEEEYGDENVDWFNVKDGCHTVKRSLDFKI
ncbi:pollenless 3-like protein [Tanacetum coccineum]